MAEPLLFTPTSHLEQQTTQILSGIANLHIACIQHDHTMAQFRPPLDHSQVTSWWRDRFAEVGRRTRHIIVLLETTSSHSDRADDVEVVGVVSLSMPQAQTGPMRGGVEKLFVSPRRRGQGMARRLMRTLEAVARKEDRWLLRLDTEKGSPAESLYPKFGYVRMGECPNYGFSPKDGRLVDEVFFWWVILSLIFPPFLMFWRFER